MRKREGRTRFSEAGEFAMQSVRYRHKFGQDQFVHALKSRANSVRVDNEGLEDSILFRVVPFPDVLA